MLLRVFVFEQACIGALLCTLLLSQVLAVVSQASVAFVFFFAFVVATICFSPIHSAGALNVISLTSASLVKLQHVTVCQPLVHVAPASFNVFGAASRCDHRVIVTFHRQERRVLLRACSCEATTEHYAGPLVLWRTDGLLVAFPVIAYGYTAHQFLFNIYATLRVPSVKRMVNVVQHVRLVRVVAPHGPSHLSVVNPATPPYVQHYAHKCECSVHAFCMVRCITVGVVGPHCRSSLCRVTVVLHTMLSFEADERMLLIAARRHFCSAHWFISLSVPADTPHSEPGETTVRLLTMCDTALQQWLQR